MTKFTSALLACLLCSSAAFGFDPIGFIKKTVSDEGDITAGFDRNNRLGVVKDDVYKLMWQDGLYWSSTGRADDSSRAWLVDFWFGGVGWNDVSNRGFVRCVRQY